jgi:hypothetical protein
MCGTTFVEVLLAVIQENRMRLGDLTDSEVSPEWTWTGTTIEYHEIHTWRTPLAYLQDPMLVIANGELGVTRDGQNRQGTIPTMSILNIDRAVPPLILMARPAARELEVEKEKEVLK